MTNPTDPRPLRAVTEPGGPSASTSPRAGSTNHQDSTHPSTRKDNPMDIEQAEHPADTLDEDSDELCPHCEFRDAVRVTSVVVIVLSTMLLYRDVLIGQMDQHGHWGWFTGGVVAAMLLDMTTSALAWLYQAGWVLWLHTRPVPAWVPGWAVPNTTRGHR